MIWPPQDTGKFAYQQCAQCCPPPPPPPLVWERHTSLFSVDEVAQVPPYYMTMTAPSYSITITPQARDPITGIVAVGVMEWEPERFGDLAGTPLECQGCYGYECLDGDGNPIGGSYGVNGTGPLRHRWEFYYVANLEHGSIDDVLANPFTVQAYCTNMPTCECFDGFPETVERTITW